jgi:hypothetical protein
MGLGGGSEPLPLSGSFFTGKTGCGVPATVEEVDETARRYLGRKLPIRSCRLSFRDVGADKAMDRALHRSWAIRFLQFFQKIKQ